MLNRREARPSCGARRYKHLEGSQGSSPAPSNSGPGLTLGRHYPGSAKSIFVSGLLERAAMKRALILPDAKKWDAHTSPTATASLGTFSNGPGVRRLTQDRSSELGAGECAGGSGARRPLVVERIWTGPYSTRITERDGAGSVTAAREAGLFYQCFGCRLTRSTPCMASAARTSVRWEKACGKFPAIRFSLIEYSSLSRPSSLARPTSTSIRFLASPQRPDRAYCSTSQKEHARNACSPGSNPSTPVSVR